MNNYILMTACFALGILLRRMRRLPENAAATLNGFIVNISLPALTLAYVHELKMEPGLVVPALMAWVLFGLGCVFFWLVSKPLALDRASTGALILTGGLANTSFLGLPMIETFYGHQYLGLGILIDQVGSYLVLSTVGIVVALICSSGNEVSLRSIVRKVLTFVPFQAFVLALLLMPMDYPDWLDALFKRVGSTLVPLALVSVGCQLRLSHMAGKRSALAVGLLFKLVLGPALICGLFLTLFGASGPVLRVTIFEAAMAPMIGASIVAMDHKLDAPLVTLMVGIGIPLSFVSLPIWAYLLQYV